MARNRFPRTATQRPPAAGRKSERGQILIMVAGAAVVLFGLTGLAIDLGRMYMAKAQLSRAVDAAALAGVLEFNGQPTGLTNAQTKAQEYMDANEPTAAETITPDGLKNELTVDATKSVNMYFLSVLGITSATVKAHAKAGFGTLTVDAALVIDSTNSMVGGPITQAKLAAEDFKNVLLGSAPTGNVVVGATPFRGCYRSTSPAATKPWANSRSNCVQADTQISFLTSNSAQLSSIISAIDATGGSGTNVCNGIAKGWEILDGPNNHTDPVQYPNNRRYVILLSDGDNNYTGNYTFQTDGSPPAPPYESPHSYNGYSCRPHEGSTACSNVGGESQSASNPCEDDTINTGAIGELSDASPSPSCSSTPVKRERQMDMKTIEMANALKAADVEVFVVAFGVCQTNSTVYTSANCQPTYSGGVIGNTSNDNTGDQRLLKCIASSRAGTNDHYYWASSASALPAIFTAIANQIAHRLIE